MKERQRWKSEEDALLLNYVNQYGPREWGLVAQRMNAPFFNRDAKSCLERWKNYLRPGIKKGSLTEEEQRLVIRLQAKHGNKWKKIAAEVPGRTAKRLGKWWEVFKERKQREEERDQRGGIVGAGTCGAVTGPVDQGKYGQLLENFAEKLAKGRDPLGVGLLLNHPHPPEPPLLIPPNILTTPPLIPPWLHSNNNNPAPCSMMRHPSTSPSVTLTLSSPTTTASPPPGGVVSSYSSWLQSPLVVVTESAAQHNRAGGGNPSTPLPLATSPLSELRDCCRDLEDGHSAWATHKKEANWMLRRVDLQLQSEKARKKREKMDQIDAKIRAIREEERAALDRIDSEYREQIVGLRREAEAKEHKLVEQWSAKHMLLAKFLDQMQAHNMGMGGGGGCRHQ